MAAKKRRAAAPAEARSVTGAPQPPPASDGWRWRTFPVFFALCVGLLAASFINGRPSNTFAAIVQIGAMLGVVYGLIHMFIANVVRAGHARYPHRAARKRRAPAYEDEVVFPPDEAPPAP